VNKLNIHERGGAYALRDLPKAIIEQHRSSRSLQKSPVPAKSDKTAAARRLLRTIQRRRPLTDRRRWPENKFVAAKKRAGRRPLRLGFESMASRYLPA